MSGDFKEIYAEEGLSLTELIQEWINENIDQITCKCKKTEFEYQQNS